MQTNGKFSGQKTEKIHRNIESKETPKQLRIPAITKYSLQWKIDRTSKS